MIHTP
jgi:hypothetical protein